MYLIECTHLFTFLMCFCFVVEVFFFFDVVVASGVIHMWIKPITSHQLNTKSSTYTKFTMSMMFCTFSPRFISRPYLSHYMAQFYSASVSLFAFIRSASLFLWLYHPAPFALSLARGRILNLLFQCLYKLAGNILFCVCLFGAQRVNKAMFSEYMGNKPKCPTSKNHT